jgi:hypothetical protein
VQEEYGGWVPFALIMFWEALNIAADALSSTSKTAADALAIAELAELLASEATLAALAWSESKYQPM